MASCNCLLIWKGREIFCHVVILCMCECVSVCAHVLCVFVLIFHENKHDIEEVSWQCVEHGVTMW